jgi:LysM repeat protein
LAAVPPPTGQAALPPRRQRTYTVRPGDRVTTIAARFGVSPTALIRANGLRGLQWIWVGQVLRIP